MPDPTVTDNKGAALIIKSDGTGIETHAIDGSGDIDVLTTSGDMVIQSGSSAARLGITNGGDQLTINRSTQLPSWKVTPTQSASGWNIPEDETSDCYAALQAAFDSIRLLGGGTFEFTGGVTYLVTQTPTVGSNTRIIGNGATIKAHGSFVGTNANNNCYLLRNYNHGHNNIPATVSSLTDSDIYIHGLNFDYNN